MTRAQSPNNAKQTVVKLELLIHQNMENWNRRLSFPMSLLMWSSITIRSVGGSWVLTRCLRPRSATQTLWLMPHITSGDQPGETSSVRCNMDPQAKAETSFTLLALFSQWINFITQIKLESRCAAMLPVDIKILYIHSSDKIILEFNISSSWSCEFDCTLSFPNLALQNQYLMQ